MTLDYHNFIKGISNVDLDDLCLDWQWLLDNQFTAIMVSCSGDMFLTDEKGAVNWLDTGTGQLQKIADTIPEFESALKDVDNIDKWFLAPLVLDLIEKNMVLKENEVYSYKVMPALGGDYSIDNFEKTDISVHFSMTGQICRQIKDLPDGTRVDAVKINPFTKGN
jgi:hypothetical protein